MARDVKRREMTLVGVMLVVGAAVGLAGTVEFAVEPTRTSIAADAMRPFVEVVPIARNDAPPLSLCWQSAPSEHDAVLLSVKVTPLASIDVAGRPRAIVRDVTGRLDVTTPTGRTSWTIEQAHFGAATAFSVFLVDRNRLTLLMPVRFVSTEADAGDIAPIAMQLLVTCQLSRTHESWEAACEPPRPAFDGPLLEIVRDAIPTSQLLAKTSLPLRERAAHGVDLGVLKQDPEDTSCCHNLWYTRCKCTAECPIGDCASNCTHCTGSACEDCRDLFVCLNNCSG
jgi:hypothetical protein